MGQLGKKTRKRRSQSGDRERRNGRSGGSAKDEPSRTARSYRRGFRDPIFRFVVIVGAAMVLFNVFFYIGVTKDSLFGSYLNLNARLSAAFLNALGDDVTVTGTLISSPRFSLAVAPGCDGIQASAFFVFAVLAAPISVSWPARIRAVLIGTALLLSMNLVRLITLYYTGIYIPGAFQVMHVDVWQAVFIFLPIIFWLTWLVRAARKRASGPNAAT